MITSTYVQLLNLKVWQQRKHAQHKSEEFTHAHMQLYMGWVIAYCVTLYKGKKFNYVLQETFTMGMGQKSSCYKNVEKPHTQIHTDIKMLVKILNETKHACTHTNKWRRSVSTPDVFRDLPWGCKEGDKRSLDIRAHLCWRRLVKEIALQLVPVRR